MRSFAQIWSVWVWGLMSFFSKSHACFLVWICPQMFTKALLLSLRSHFKCVNATLWFPEKFNLKCTEKKTECDVGRLSPQIFSVIAHSKCQYRPNTLLKGQFPVFPVTSYSCSSQPVPGSTWLIHLPSPADNLTLSSALNALKDES